MQISEQHVRECAYYIWEKEGRIHGHAVAHWIRAEAELRAGVVLADGQAVEAKPVAAKAPASKVAAPKAAAKTAAPKAPAKAAAPKAAASKTVTPKDALAKPVAAKTAKASKAAVTAGLAAKAKPARAPASMH
ncbi:DUF2934 domain-containing protein [Methylobacterium brachiatum]|jgi:hypothetical protein|uniref:DUF2934 domain-containing protein n=1 Tax=Methylobacterium brachiatum TaxID=269660 RepID=A0ABV1QW72_9HYPH